MNLSFIYPIAYGDIEEVVTSEQAIALHKQSQLTSSKPDLEISDEHRLDEFKTIHWAIETNKAPGLYLKNCTEGNPPTGTTHFGPYGFLKKVGKFFYIYKNNGWYALSGEPMGKIYLIKGD